MRHGMRRYITIGAVLTVLLFIGGWLGLGALRQDIDWPPLSFRRIVLPDPDR